MQFYFIINYLIIYFNNSKHLTIGVNRYLIRYYYLKIIYLESPGWLKSFVITVIYFSVHCP